MGHQTLLGRQYAKDLDLVFCRRDGQPLDNGHALAVLRRVLKKCGLPTAMWFHDLRHLFGTYLAAAGEPVKVIQEVMGHSTPATTLQFYQHVMPGMKERAMRSLERALFGNAPKQTP